MNRIWGACCVAAAALFQPPAWAGEPAFSVDLQRFSYSYGSVSHVPDFALPSGFPSTYIDPLSGWHLTWDAIEAPLPAGTVGDVWRMPVPQATLAVPEPPRSLTSINGLGCVCTGLSPREWEVTARFSGISNANLDGTVYQVEVGGGDYNPAAPNVHVRASWFNGSYLGTHYDHVLLIETSVAVGTYAWDSGDTPLFLSDANPADTVIELRGVVSDGGETFSSYYRLDNEPDWHLVRSHTLPIGVGVLSGFASSHPYVSVSNELAPVPELPAALLLGAGGVLLGGVIGRRRARPSR